MTTTPETRAIRVKNIRDRTHGQATQNDVQWLCETVQALLDEREEVQQALAYLSAEVDKLHTLLLNKKVDVPQERRCSHCGEKSAACGCEVTDD